VIGWLVFSTLKYRHGVKGKDPEDEIKAGRLPSERGTVKGAIILTLVVAGILLPISVGTMQTVDLIEHPPVGENIVVKVEGFQWNWKFTYPNGKVSLGELKVPRGTVVLLEVTSNDVFHNFGAYELKVKADAIPGKVNRIWMNFSKPSQYDILCFELCGAGHTLMRGKLTVMEPGEFANWYAS